MIMIKVFTLDENGKISFTKEELEKLLEEVEKEAYERGRSSVTNQQLLPYYNNHGTTDPFTTSGTPIMGNKTVVTC